MNRTGLIASIAAATGLAAGAATSYFITDHYNTKALDDIARNSCLNKDKREFEVEVTRAKELFRLLGVPSEKMQDDPQAFVANVRLRPSDMTDEKVKAIYDFATHVNVRRDELINKIHEEDDCGYVLAQEAWEKKVKTAQILVNWLEDTVPRYPDLFVNLSPETIRDFTGSVRLRPASPNLDYGTPDASAR